MTEIDALTEFDKACRNSLCTPTAYRLTGYREIPAREGVAWHGTIRLNGVKVGEASDEGRGGMVEVSFVSREAQEAFRAEAEARYGTRSLEQEGHFASHLATACQLSRKRAVAFITDESDVAMGEFFTFKSTVTFDQAKTALANPEGPFASLNPRIWDKNASAYVPVA